jgi:hypothetical protein
LWCSFPSFIFLLCLVCPMLPVSLVYIAFAHLVQYIAILFDHSTKRMAFYLDVLILKI